MPQFDPAFRFSSQGRSNRNAKGCLDLSPKEPETTLVEKFTRVPAGNEMTVGGSAG